MKHPSALIVDDEVELQQALCEHLGLEGWNVQGANDGIQALDVLGSRDFDVIVSDIRMPGMDGLALLRSVRQVNNTITFVLMSGYTEVPVWDCFAQGASEVLGKPFQFRDLQRLMERACLPLTERWGEAGKIYIPGKIHGHLDVKRNSHHGFGMGRSGFLIDAGDKLAITRGDIISFYIELPRVVLDGIGKVRWKRRSGDGISDTLGIEFLFLEEKSRRLAVRMIEESYIKACIPSTVAK